MLYTSPKTTSPLTPPLTLAASCSLKFGGIISYNFFGGSIPAGPGILMELIVDNNEEARLMDFRIGSTDGNVYVFPAGRTCSTQRPTASPTATPAPTNTRSPSLAPTETAHPSLSPSHMPTQWNTLKPTTERFPIADVRDDDSFWSTKIIIICAVAASVIAIVLAALCWKLRQLSERINLEGHPMGSFFDNIGDFLGSRPGGGDIESGPNQVSRICFSSSSH